MKCVNRFSTTKNQFAKKRYVLS